MRLAVGCLRDSRLQKVSDVRAYIEHLVKRKNIFFVHRQWPFIGSRVIRADEIRNDPENALGILRVLGGIIRGRLNFIRQIFCRGIAGLSLILRRLLGGLRRLRRRVLTLRSWRRTRVLRVRGGKR